VCLYEGQTETEAFLFFLILLTGAEIYDNFVTAAGTRVPLHCLPLTASLPLSSALEPAAMVSAWPYRFVNLTVDQLEDRRITLDRNGFYAWLSPIALLGVIFAIRRVTSPSTKNAARLSDKPMEQPPSALQLQQRRILWWLNQPLTQEFGPRKVHILGAVYACWLFFLTFRQTGDDFLHLTKRFGHVAVSQLPFQYMMAIKSPRNPAQFATGLSHEVLNPYHRLFGRIIHLFLAAHAVLYMIYFSMAGILGQRVGNWDVRLGLAAFLIFNILAVTAIPPIRKLAYHNKFYKAHAILSGLLMPALFFHVPFARKYVYQMVAYYVFNGAARKNSTTVPIISSVVPIPGTSLLKLRVPGPAWGVPPLMGAGTPGWVPGQHFYVKQSISPAMPRSPFTVVSLPPAEGQDGGDESSNIDLVIRNLNGPNTGWLAAKPKETGLSLQNVKVLVEGPYGEAKEYVPELFRVGESGGSILLVAGGVGATFTIPIYLSLLAKRKSTRDIHFVWAVRSVQDAEWGLAMLKTAKAPEVNAAVYITEESDKSLHETVVEETRNGLKVLSYRRRPEMKALVDGVFSPNGVQEKGTFGNSKSYVKVNVLACGPPSMMLALRTEVGRHVMGYGRDVLYHEEAFGLGA
jgi:NAD(P)H-flavin reductase